VTEVNGSDLQPDAGLRALIYDDDEIYSEECAEALSRFGYRTMTRRGRTDFLNVVKGFTPDVIILDIHMPGTDGMESLRALSDYEGKDNLSVVMISGANQLYMESAVKLAKAYGVNLIGMCAKPLVFKELLLLLASQDIRTRNSSN